MRKDYDWSNYNKRYRRKMERKVFEQFKQDLLDNLSERMEEFGLTHQHIVKLIEFMNDFEKKEVRK